MVNSAAAQLGGIAGGILKNILYMLGVIIFAVGIWFGSREIQKRSKRNRKFTFNTLIIDKIGQLDSDKLAFEKNIKDQIFEIYMKKRGGKNGLMDSLPIIPKDCFKDNWCVLYNYAPGQYSPIHPTSWKYILDKDFLTNPKKLKLVNINMKSYLRLKQRIALNRVEQKRENWMKKMPWITIGAVLALALLAVAISVFVGNHIYANNFTQRLLECKGALH